MSILYTTQYCPKCEYIKARLRRSKIPFEICEDEDEAAALGIKEVPCLKQDDKLLYYADLMRLTKIEE